MRWCNDMLEKGKSRNQGADARRPPLQSGDAPRPPIQTADPVRMPCQPGLNDARRSLSLDAPSAWRGNAVDRWHRATRTRSQRWRQRDDEEIVRGSPVLLRGGRVIEEGGRLAVAHVGR